jgi:mono/diheme cytochrome c family protein
MAAAAATNRSAKRNLRKSPGFLAAGVGLTLAVISAGSAVADDAAAARGGYLAAVAGCGTCHTDSKNDGAPYAGGRVIQTEFGTIATPNITPDRATGIGGWSQADFERAMRWGVAPDGTHYLTAFPFPYFGRLTDGDLADLKTFLDGVVPVSRPRIAGAAALALFARARAMIGVAIEANSTTPPAPPRDATTARGFYLVTTIGRCDDCHTPLTWFGAPDRERYLAGSSGEFAGKKAPNITPDERTGIGKWSEDEIASLLKDGEAPDGDFVGGAMAEIVRNTARLTDGDRRAIAVYLKTVPAKAFNNHK